MGDSREGAAHALAMRAALAGRAVFERCDQAIAGLAPKDQPGLVIFIFHCVFADAGEIEQGVVDPHERATCESLGELIEYFRAHGYDFVSAGEIERGLPSGGRHAHLTFDDGLANNMRLIDFLAQEEAHATVFPSISHVLGGHSFWWNALYRERRRQGRLKNISAEYSALRKLTYEEIEQRLRGEFGSDVLQPAGDLDRPMTVEELREMSRSPWIEIGNHTMSHRILPACSIEEAGDQIGGAQRWLADTLGEAPFFIAYPAGKTNETVMRVAESQGLRLGVTVVPAHNPLPIDSDRMQLSRFRVVFDRRAQQRMKAVRSSVQLTSFMRGLAIRD